MGSKWERAKQIATSILSPMGSPASAEDYMGKRKNKLEKMGGKMQGGMFDLIYKKRKEREDALSQIEY